MMNTKLLKKKLRGHGIFNEWQRAERQKTLPRLTIQESVQQYLHLQSFTRNIAPEARQFFFEDNLAHHIVVRKKFKRIAQRMKRGPRR